ncbi:hypothetical protein [Stackebrandtia nassauensis]|uniref:Uncharacterized protein n=1 Tax=Stackebrandtia nassauensis (strain DSM 44728 / CIP 108903 / NRRL B-16338 / NBRC 102104 / LLR-40K-21) TaxID=446470 RepID=D3PUX1_STANL|nr:hypothetical protein [Stackebrandtia nassauensis]ADD44995.1 hypothetical protein Snas_5362 [Stackebrandtia nassauensis DSM 44728]
MNVKVNDADLHDAATAPSQLPALIGCAKDLAAMTAEAQGGTPHLGGSAHALYTLASYMNDAIIRNHKSVAAGLEKAAIDYKNADDEGDREVSKALRLLPGDLRRKAGR